LQNKTNTLDKICKFSLCTGKKGDKHWQNTTATIAFGHHCQLTLHGGRKIITCKSILSTEVILCENLRNEVP